MIATVGTPVVRKRDGLRGVIVKLGATITVKLVDPVVHFWTGDLGDLRLAFATA